MPFAGTYYDPFFKDHQDWFVKREDGKPYETAWGGTCLDMTQPGAREHLRDVASRITRDWGFKYIKVDGLWTGTGTKQQYVNTGYKDDQIGEAVFSSPDKSNIESYRDALRLLREAAGKDVGRPAGGRARLVPRDPRDRAARTGEVDRRSFGFVGRVDVERRG